MNKRLSISKSRSWPQISLPGCVCLHWVFHLGFQVLGPLSLILDLKSRPKMGQALQSVTVITECDRNYYRM